jgi:hypothetical protein
MMGNVVVEATVVEEDVMLLVILLENSGHSPSDNWTLDAVAIARVVLVAGMERRLCEVNLDENKTA